MLLKNCKEKQFPLKKTESEKLLADVATESLWDDRAGWRGCDLLTPLQCEGVGKRRQPVLGNIFIYKEKVESLGEKVTQSHLLNIIEFNKN